MIKDYLKNPLSLILAILVAYGLAWVCLFDITSIVQCLQASYENRTLKLSEMIRTGIRSAGRAMYPKNWFMIVFMILILPLTGISELFGISVSYSIPGFIMSYITADKVLNVVFWVAILILFILCFNWIFCIHTFLFECTSFAEARKKSAALLKGRHIRTFLKLVGWFLFVAFLFLLIAGLLFGGMILIIRLSFPENSRFYTARTVAPVVGIILDYFLSVIYIPLIFAKVTELYITYSLEPGFAARGGIRR